VTAQPVTLPALFCGFNIRITFPANKEYGKALTAADGTTLITGSLTAAYTNLSTGKTITKPVRARQAHPATRLFDHGGQGPLWAAPCPADAQRFGLPTVAVTAGAQTTALALPSGAVTSLTLHGYVLVNVCTARS
jgi:hypothetical protein